MLEAYNSSWQSGIQYKLDPLKHHLKLGDWRVTESEVQSSGLEVRQTRDQYLQLCDHTRVT